MRIASGPLRLECSNSINPTLHDEQQKLTTPARSGATGGCAMAKQGCVASIPLSTTAPVISSVEAGHSFPLASALIVRREQATASLTRRVG